MTTATVYTNALLGFMLLLVCVPLLGIGYGATLLDKVLSERLRQNRQRVRCEKIRKQRSKQRDRRRELRRELRNALLRDSQRRSRHEFSPEDVAKQWDKSHDSLEEMIRFGAMLLDVEDTVDSSLVIEQDKSGNPFILGRNPGLKGWLAEHCPHIGYKTAMRYKSLAEKVMQVKESKRREAFIAKSETIHELQESLYRHLGIAHYPLEEPRTKGEVSPYALQRPGQGRNHNQSLIYRIRSRTHDALRVLPPRTSKEAKRFITAFQVLADEVKGAP